MALTVKHATLPLRLFEIFMTPFAFMGVRLVMRWWVFVAIGIICTGLWLTGAMQLALPRTADVIIGILTVCFLWFVATLLTILDHFRFQGYTYAASDPLAVASARKFLDALFKRSRADPNSFFSTEAKQKDSEALKRFANWRKELGDCSTVVDATELCTTDDVLFRAALQKIKHLDLEKDEVLLLVPLVSDLDLPVGASMKLASFLIRPAFGPDIEYFEVLSLPRPAILG